MVIHKRSTPIVLFILESFFDHSLCILIILYDAICFAMVLQWKVSAIWGSYICICKIMYMIFSSFIQYLCDLIPIFDMSYVTNTSLVHICNDRVIIHNYRSTSCLPTNTNTNTFIYHQCYITENVITDQKSWNEV